MNDRKMAAVLRRASQDPGMTIEVLARMVCVANHPRQKKPCPQGAHTEYVRRLLAEEPATP